MSEYASDTATFKKMKNPCNIDCRFQSGHIDTMNMKDSHQLLTLPWSCIFYGMTLVLSLVVNFITYKPIVHLSKNKSSGFEVLEGQLFEIIGKQSAASYLTISIASSP